MTNDPAQARTTSSSRQGSNGEVTSAGGHGTEYSPPGNPYPAALYAATHTGNPGDIDFYLRACANADPILELGCGTGRVGGRLVAAGHTVVGIDSAEDALTFAAKTGIKTVLGDMCDFSLAQRFERIIIPYNGLYNLLTEQALVDCLSTARGHLARTGEVIFDVYAGDGFADVDDAEVAEPEEPENVAQIVVDGVRWDVFEESTWVPTLQRIVATYTYVTRDGRETVRATIDQRYLFSHQLPQLLSKASLEMLSLHGDFNDQAFDENREFLVVRCASSA